MENGDITYSRYCNSCTLFWVSEQFFKCIFVKIEKYTFDTHFDASRTRETFAPNILLFSKFLTKFFVQQILEKFLFSEFLSQQISYSAKLFIQQHFLFSKSSYSAKLLSKLISYSAKFSPNKLLIQRISNSVNFLFRKFHIQQISYLADIFFRKFLI